MVETFLKFADLPPDPTDPAALRTYKELGFNVCLLTEDNVKMVRDGQLSEEYRQAIENIAESGMDVWVRNMYNDPDYFECDRQKAGSNYGSPYELPPRKIADEIPSVKGFYMADEAYMYQLPKKTSIPWMRDDCDKYASFDQLIKLVDWKNKYYPNAFWHMNHVPGQSWDHYLPKDGKIYDYKDFLTEYADVILRRLKNCERSLTLDNYPLIGEDYIEKDYLCDLLTAADVVKNYNESVGETDQAKFGICLQTFRAKAITDDRCRDITGPEEITFQMYVGMALGAKMFEYFCYRTFESMLGILDADGQKRIYDFVRTANTNASAMEQKIFPYQYTGAFVVPGEECSENTAAFVLAKDLFRKDNFLTVSSSHDILVGCLEDGEKKGYLIVNYTDPVRRHTSRVSVCLQHQQTASCLLNGREIIAENGHFCLAIEPGNAAFIYY